MDEFDTECGEIWLQLDNQSRNAVFEDLLDGGRFLEAFTYVWGTAESDIDQGVLFQFDLVEIGMGDKDFHPKKGIPKVRYILRASFDRKIDFLVEVKAMTKQHRKLLLDLYSKRNQLFHGGNYSQTVLHMDRDQWKSYLQVASDVLNELLFPLTAQD